MGNKDVKNIAEPVPVFRVGLGPVEAHSVPGTPNKPGRATVTPGWKWAALAASVMLLLSAGGFAVWQFDRADPSSAPATDATPAPQATAAQPVVSKTSIAVLPFANMSVNSTDDDFTDGITEDIITSLAQFEDLDVISRNSVFTYKGKPVKVQQVGEELGVKFVLEGSVRTSGKRVRVTAQLVEAATGHHLWAERYDREMADVFALQDELTRAIVSNLAAFAVKTTDSGTQRVRVEGVGTVIKVRIKKKRVTLDHLEIKGFMEAMEMSYKVNSAALLDGLEPGEKVFFTLDIENKTITAIRPQNEK
jgi:TolB-like protein